MLYQISHGVVQFGDTQILEDVNFEIRNTEKIAVVGRNGCGKTTLLKLIAGEYEITKLDSDQEAFIAKAGNPVIGYLKQIAFEDPTVSMETELRKELSEMENRKKELDQLAVALETDYSEEMVHRYTRMQEAFEADGGYYYEKEYETLVRKFGFSEADKKKPLNQFSGGQQTKIAFIKLLLSKPDILLLDEPTNHLDITTIQWLESYLKNYSKAVVVVSHDRMFLDNVVDVVYEIEYGVTRRYVGDYSNFVVQKRALYEKQKKDFAAQQKEIARLQEIVDKFKYKPTKASMAKSKLKQIEHMVKIQPPDQYDNQAFHAQFQPKEETGNDVLSVRDLTIGYDHPLSTVQFDLKKGDKLAIIGGNGLGKSTLLKVLMGQIPALSGEYHYGVHVQIGYFDQQMAQYRSDKTVLNDFWDEFPQLSQTEARNALGAFLFKGEDVFKDVNMLSGGKKVRLALCKIFKRKPNVLILDEPTNHMDIIGKETLEAMLKDFSGTLVFVSHDRYFVKKVCKQLLVFENGNAELYRFGYEEYQEKMAKQAEEEEDFSSNRKVPSPATPSNQTTDNSANKSNKSSGGIYLLGKERSKLERKIKKVEEKLAEDEAVVAELKAKMEDPAIQSRYSKLTELQEQIDAAEAVVLEDMEEWESLSLSLEELGES